MQNKEKQEIEMTSYKMEETTTQVICTCSKIKEGCLDDVCNWLKTLIDRKEETLESFRKEGVWLESAFIRKSQDGYFLIYYMRADDVKTAMTIFHDSSLPIDHFHKECWSNYTEQHEILTQVFHLENQQKL